MKRNTCDVAIIGGGAAALMIAAKLCGRRAVLFEKNGRVGKKLLATGNGKCNLSAVDVAPEKYNNPEFVRGFLGRYGAEDAVCDFARFGLFTKQMEGRIYPYSECASSVLDALRAAAVANGAEFLCDREVVGLAREKDGFTLRVEVKTEDGKQTEEYRARNVVLAGGSRATFGTDSTSLFKALGHKAKPFVPSLCPLKTDRESVKGLSGIRVKCALTLAGRTEKGEVLFKDFGLSGIATFNLSAFVARGEAKVGDEIAIDFMPEYSEHEVAEIFRKMNAENTEKLLKGFFHSMVSQRIAERAGCKAGEKPDVERLARIVKNYKTVLKGLVDESFAQVMSGGLDTDEFDGDLQSRLCKGAYAAGEILDIDGLCGGYNLQWAWTSAAVVARALSQK